MYKLSKFPEIILKMVDGEYKTSFPMVDGNSEYEEYKKWLAQGNTPEPADVESIASIKNDLKSYLRNNWIEIKSKLRATGKTEDFVLDK